MSAAESLVRPLGRALRSRRAGFAHSVDAASGGLEGLAAPASAAPISVSSPAFVDGGEIPLRHSGRGLGENVSPALAWSPLPAGTRAVLLVMEDPDVPFRAPAVHLAVVLPPTGGVARGELARDSAVGRFLPGLAGRRGYDGPRPLPGHGPHSYLFFVYALDASPEGATLRAVIESSRGHVLACGRLEGVQER